MHFTSSSTMMSTRWWCCQMKKRKGKKKKMEIVSSFRLYEFSFFSFMELRAVLMSHSVRYEWILKSSTFLHELEMPNFKWVRGNCWWITKLSHLAHYSSLFHFSYPFFSLLSALRLTFPLFSFELKIFCELFTFQSRHAHGMYVRFFFLAI